MMSGTGHGIDQRQGPIQLGAADIVEMDVEAVGEGGGQAFAPIVACAEPSRSIAWNAKGVGDDRIGSSVEVNAL
jgi:hypothetical protein